MEENINLFYNLKRILTVLIEHEDDFEIEKLYVKEIEEAFDDIYVSYLAIGREQKDFKRGDIEGSIYIKKEYFDMSNEEIIQNFFGEEE